MSSGDVRHHVGLRIERIVGGERWRSTPVRLSMSLRE